MPRAIRPLGMGLLGHHRPGMPVQRREDRGWPPSSFISFLTRQPRSRPCGLVGHAVRLVSRALVPTTQQWLARVISGETGSPFPNPQVVVIFVRPGSSEPSTSTCSNQVRPRLALANEVAMSTNIPPPFNLNTGEHGRVRSWDPCHDIAPTSISRCYLTI